MAQPLTCQGCEASLPGNRNRRTNLCRLCYQREYNRLHSDPNYQAVYQANKRARQMGSVGSVTLKEWLELKNLHANRCAYCGFVTDKLHLEHVVPLSEARRGNESATNTVFNIVPACGMCNRAKGSLPLIVFLGWKSGMLAA